MKKFAIDKVYGSIKYGAGDKAHYDVSRTLKKCGYNIITFIEPNYSYNFLNKIIRYFYIFLLYIKIKNSDEILFQYPGLISSWLLNKLKNRKIRIVLLLHDVESIRTPGSARKEIDIFNLADIIIAHTPAMRNSLIDKGVKSSIKILYLFDYYTNGEEPYNEKDWRSIVFAGSLSKSRFLKEIDTNNCPLKFYLYGKGFVPNQNNCFSYEGVFSPENISKIKGGWGLVWDGDSIHTCNGNIGNYLKYNSSHKISLYLVTGKPLIVWEKSSLAEYVKVNKLGIVVTSIEDAISQITKMDKSGYDSFRKCVLTYKTKLNSGYFLQDVIS